MREIFKRLNKINNYISKWCFNIDSDYKDYGECPSFTIFKNANSCISGHMLVKKSDSNHEIAYTLTSTILKMCKKNDISITDALKIIDQNLKDNNLK